MKQIKTIISILIICFIIHSVNAKNSKAHKLKTYDKEILDKKKNIIFCGNIFSETYNKHIENVKIELITLNKIYRTYSSAEGDFKLSIPHQIIKDNNIIKISFDNIPHKNYKTIEELENDPCPVCFYDTKIFNLSRNKINTPFDLKMKARHPYLGSPILTLNNEENSPFIYFNGKQISFEEYQKNKKKYTEINSFPSEYTKFLCGKENKNGIKICF